jgi:hypothetical protein
MIFFTIHVLNLHKPAAIAAFSTYFISSVEAGRLISEYLLIDYTLLHCIVMLYRIFMLPSCFSSSFPTLASGRYCSIIFTKVSGPRVALTHSIILAPK